MGVGEVGTNLETGGRVQKTSMMDELVVWICVNGMGESVMDWKRRRTLEGRRGDVVGA